MVTLSSNVPTHIPDFDVIPKERWKWNLRYLSINSNQNNFSKSINDPNIISKSRMYNEIE